MNCIPILLAEDDENDVIFVRHAFREAQIFNPLHVVQTGTEVIEYLSGKGKFADRTQFPLPCLMLLDINMPVRNGVEILKWLREQADIRHIIVIVWTASADPSLLRQAYQHGVNSVLRKPENLAELSKLARLIKSYWLEANQMVPECHSLLREG
jgi:CheY-like chemotaxis protein